MGNCPDPIPWPPDGATIAPAATTGEYTTIYNRFNRWTYAGIWDRVMEAVADAHNIDTVMVDGTSVRVHHSAATLKKTTRVVAWAGRGVG
ncbi:transposase [Rhodophyticola sp. CCM32]|uniref:transposase n=1 Tax=Rhodophyticola sp. CCM32 TaxID=2916397 RepID=UPI00143DDAE0|nr:transposase [Rhodophyticola sp. CCM32]